MENKFRNLWVNPKTFATASTNPCGCPYEVVTVTHKYEIHGVSAVGNLTECTRCRAQWMTQRQESELDMAVQRELASALESANAENERLREALEFYARPESIEPYLFEIPIKGTNGSTRPGIKMGFYRKASEALNPAPPSQAGKDDVE